MPTLFGEINYGEEGMLMRLDEIERNIASACAELYQHEYALIKQHAHERTISAHLSSFLRPLFPKWNVDAEYNREGPGIDTKRDFGGNAIFPDIIIHTRGRREGPNLVAIEMKGFWNKEPRRLDEEALYQLRRKFNYRYIFRLELGVEKADLFQVQ